MTKNTPKPLDHTRPLWEQQPDETDKAFAAFTHYRDLGPNRRSIRQVARVLGKSVTLIGRWSSDWSWPRRAQAWDQHVDRETAKEQVEAVARMRRNLATVGSAGVNLVAQWLQQATPADLKAADVPRILAEFSKVWRYGLGEPEETAKTDQSIEALLEVLGAGVSDDELDRLLRDLDLLPETPHPEGR